MILHPEIPFPGPNASKKRSFHVRDMLERIRAAVQAFPKALHYKLYDRGYKSVFQQVVISQLCPRTEDVATIEAASQLFRWAGTPERVARLSVAQIEALIAPVAYAAIKAERIHAIAELACRNYGGELPCRERVLIAIPGVGNTCVNLVLSLSCNMDKICVGANVQRVVQRWGYVTATSPTGIEAQLCEKVPRKYRKHVNEWLVPFAQNICTKDRPICSTCPVAEYCRQVGVTDPR